MRHATHPHAALAGGEIHLWSVELLRPPRDMAVLAGWLSEDERARAARFRLERDRRRYVAGRGALRAVLSRYEGVAPARLRFAYGAHGKPRLQREDAPGAPALAFNASHAQELMLVAVGACAALGVDVESERNLQDVDGLARHVCSAAEHRSLLELPPAHRPAAFLRCWTRKEAYVKALGTGLSTPLEQVHVGCGETPVHPEGWSLTDLQPAPGQAGALAVPGPAPRLSRFQFEG